MAQIGWQTVPMFWLDGGSELTEAQRLVALREYLTTGGITGVVLADPADYDENGYAVGGGDDELWDAGPSVDEIDWSGFR
jgi:hypothetical protein